MTLQRGDVVIIDFPQAPGSAPKRRPAVVVQADRNNSRLATSIFAVITSNLRLAGIEQTQVFIDLNEQDGQATGLARSSVVKCENVYTLPQSLVLRRIGQLSAELQLQVDDALRSSLALE